MSSSHGAADADSENSENEEMDALEEENPNDWDLNVDRRHSLHSSRPSTSTSINSSSLPASFSPSPVNPACWFDGLLFLHYTFSESTKKLLPDSQENVKGTCNHCKKKQAGRINNSGNWLRHLRVYFNEDFMFSNVIKS